ncbi:lisH domain-containing protein C1711.05-like [Telopea speciosissima]|uniref:lisH domain-containing protein C1711.05-like n=1 Tax=Telopea speciosissima TaxID=54955 RepID=UPI001CC750F1|nr:lisH domain-containing protein C1711.05-like [Telopea speciosissima]
MGTVCKIVYHYYGRTIERYVDPDKYGYLDMVYDVYSSVLRHIPKGKTVTFQMKFMLPDMIQEMEVMCDMDVLKMFCVAEQLDASRDEVSSLAVREDEFLSTMETARTDIQKRGGPSTIRPKKSTIRRGGATTMGNNIVRFNSKSIGTVGANTETPSTIRSSSRNCAKLSDTVAGFEHVQTASKCAGGVGVVKVSSQSTTTIGDTNAKGGVHVDSSSQTATIQESSAQGGEEDDSGTKDATDDEGFEMSDPDDEEWKEDSEDEVETSTDSSDSESDGDSEHSKSEVESKDELSHYQLDEAEGLKGVNQEGERISQQVG